MKNVEEGAKIIEFIGHKNKAIVIGWNSPIYLLDIEEGKKEVKQTIVKQSKLFI